MGVLQFNSILTLSTWIVHQIPQVERLVLQGLPPPHTQKHTHTFRGQLEALIITYASDELAIDWRFQPPPPWVQINFLEQTSVASHKPTLLPVLLTN